MIKNQQKEMWGRELGTSLRDLNYYKIFEAAGAHSSLVLDASDLPNAIQKAWSSNKPSFIAQNVSFRDDICHKHHKQRLCKIIITRVKVHFVDVF